MESRFSPLTAGGNTCNARANRIRMFFLSHPQNKQSTYFISSHLIKDEVNRFTEIYLLLPDSEGLTAASILNQAFNVLTD